jgi:hypothetical protein
MASIALLAQRQNGMVADNYAGYSSIQYNPANLADSRFRFNMNVIGFNAHLQNNYLQLETPHSIYKFLNWKWDSSFGTKNFDYPFREKYLVERLNGKDKFVYTNASVNAFSIQFSLKDNAGFSFGLTTKAFGKVANLPEDVLKTFSQDLDSVGYVKENQQRLLGSALSLAKSGIAALAYQQYSVKYAFLPKAKGKSYVKVGLGLDYNLGLYGAYFKSNKVDYKLTGIDTLVLNEVDLEFAYIDPNYLSSSDRRLNDYFGKSKLGRGLGLNAGIVYEHRPDNKAFKYKMDGRTQVDRSANKYDWKIAASIVDFGFVKFNNGAATRSIKVTTASPMAWNDFDEADNWNNVDNVDTFITNFFDTNVRDSSFTMFTPASLNLSADYKWKENVYFSASYSQSLMRNKGKNVRMPNVLSVAPRYESKWLTVAVPVSLSRYYNKVNLGAYIRGGIFYVGSDNLGGFFTGKKTNGLNLYAGFNWPIHYRKLEDVDGDGVSDNLDQCPNMAGTKYTDGCPDADGDKVSDDEDECPNDAGTKQTLGCPDSDGDRVADKYDLCPDTYGDKKLVGCPDSDGDGAHDGIDKCPEVAGEVQYQGCMEALDMPEETKPKDTPKDKVADKEESTFENWDFKTYAYWPVLGAYNDLRWAEELQLRLNTKLKINAMLKTIPGASKYYVTLGQAVSLKEAEEIKKVLDIPIVNRELNGTVWWKKVPR